MIVYFSGTGNSKHVAQRIADKLGDAATAAARLIKADKTPEFVSDKPYVFVAPTYAWRLPRVFQKWIAACKFEGSKQAYFVLTCGSEIGAAGNYASAFATKIGMEYMGTAQVVMPENYLVMFEPTAKEEDGVIVAAADRHVDALCEQVKTLTPFDKVKIPFVGYLESGIVNRSFYAFYVGAKKFYATDACVSCGLCVENCMLNNVTLKDGKPVWGKNCAHCMACICKCPTEAIEYGKKTKGKRRYVFGENR